MAIMTELLSINRYMCVKGISNVYTSGEAQEIIMVYIKHYSKLIPIIYFVMKSLQIVSELLKYIFCTFLYLFNRVLMISNTNINIIISIIFSTRYHCIRR